MIGKNYRQSAGSFEFDNFEIVAKDGTALKSISSVQVDFNAKKIIMHVDKVKKE